jgi:AMME syndrome candidate gene 1 protein
MATKDHCFYCFEVLSANLLKEQLPEPNFDDQAYPLFVTWKKDDILRGCIGSFSPQGLHSGLRRLAYCSAFEDTRFPPIDSSELEQLTCSVSLLTEFEDVATWNDWTIGVHGIQIKYHGYGATYLPEVAKEQGWNHLETLQSLMRKAGFRDIVSPQVLEGVKVTRYQV